MQSQYATTSQFQQLGITPAAFARFEALSPGSSLAAIQGASSLADTYLSSQFILPLVVSPQGWDMALTMYTCWIAAYEVYYQFGFNPSSPDWEILADRKDRAMKWLNGVGEKTITPLYADASGIDVDADRAGDFVISGAPVGFTNRGMTNTVGNCCFDPTTWNC